MCGREFGLFLRCCIIIIILQDYVQTGPVKPQRRFIREVYPEIEPENGGNQSQVCIVGDVVYGVDERVPAEQPCLKCRCQPPGVQCEATRCSKKPGCKAVHRSNRCCPDYQCECKINGKSYANGERLESLPGAECEVCFCRGGEIQCANVSCYIRNDCEGKQVPGRCCPKYDHCPPRESLEPKPSTSPEFSDAQTQTDNKNLPTWFSSTEVVPAVSTFNKDSSYDDVHDDNKIPIEYFQSKQEDSDKTSKITIQEIIPEMKEIPITSVPKLVEPEGQLIIEETKVTSPVALSEKVDAQVQVPEESNNDLIVTDSEADSSEISEVFQQPPPVIKIGDRLLFLKKGEFVSENDISTPASVITIIGAEGLQRGVEDNDSSSTETTNMEETNFNDGSRDLSASSSTHILSLVKRKRKPSNQPTTTTAQVTSESTTTFSVSDVFTVLMMMNNTEKIKEKEENFTFDTISEVITTEHPINASDVTNGDLLPETPTLSINQTPLDSIPTENVPKLMDVGVEQNPAYPIIPDVMTTNIDETFERFDSDTNDHTRVSSQSPPKETKILPDILEMRHNETIPTNISNSEWLKIQNASTEGEGLIVNEDVMNETVSRYDILNSNSDASNETFDVILSQEPYENAEDTSSIDTITRDEAANLTIKTTNDSSIELLRSTESLEDSSEVSDEQVIPINKHVSLLSDENVSIEQIDNNASEITDMLISSPKELLVDLSGDALLNTLPSTNLNKSEEINSTITSRLTDVEMINLSELGLNVPDATTNPTTELPEILPKPEKYMSSLPKVVEKRENTPQSEEDEIFKQLEVELNGGYTEQPKTIEEEEVEAREIFKELLDETSTPRSKSPTQSKETEALERVSQALAKFALRGSRPALDTGILGVLTDFLSSQYRSYESSK